MHRAVQCGRVTCLTVLAGHGCDLEATDLQGNTPLWLAAWNGYEGCVRFLLDVKVDAKKPSRVHRTTPLEAAGTNGYASCANLIRLFLTGMYEVEKH